METPTTTEEYVIDATGKRLGHVASEAASVLLGKDTPTFVKHLVRDIVVRIENASKLDISDKKMEQKTYTRYTGHPGGLREETLGKLTERHGYSEAMRKAVYGMIPGNKLRDKRMKNLIITE